MPVNGAVQMIIGAWRATSFALAAQISILDDRSKAPIAVRGPRDHIVRSVSSRRAIIIASTISLLIASANTTMANQSPESSLIASAESAHSRWFWFSVGFAVLVGVAGAWLSYMVWSSGNRVQEAVRAASDARTAEASEKAAAANARASEANARAMASEALVASSDAASKDAVARVAEAQRAAAEASAKAEGFRRDIALANERAAAANATAERERFARLQLEARLADRVVTDAQRSRLVDAFAPLRGDTVEVGIFGDNPDISHVANTILECLKQAGAEFTFFNALGGGGGVRGVIVGVKPDASPSIKGVATSFVAILKETLGGGVGAVGYDELSFNGASTAGQSGKAGSSIVLRIWIGAK